MKKLLRSLTVVSITISFVIVLMSINAYALYENEVDSIHIDFDDLQIIDMIDMDFVEYLLSLEDEDVLNHFMEVRQMMFIQSAAVEAYTQIMEHFLVEVEGFLELVYPDTYAGAFIEYDTLIIQVTELNDEVISFYTRILGVNAPIRFVQVEFSLNELITFGEVFVDAIDSTIVSHGFDTINNMYNIALYYGDTTSVQIVNNFNSMSRFMSLPIAFELGEKFDAMFLPGGGHITAGAPAIPGINPPRPFHMSVGLTGLNNNSPALLTAGHSFVGMSPGTRVYFNNRHVGSVIVARFGFTSSTTGSLPVNFGNNGTLNGDWAVIALNENGAAQVRNSLRNGVSIIGFDTAPVNTIVSGIGRHTIYSGIVTSVNQQVEIGGFQVPGMTVARSLSAGDRTPIEGDSGGSIWRDLGSNRGMLVGTLAGGRERDWTFSPLTWVGNHFRRAPGV